MVTGDAGEQLEKIVNGFNTKKWDLVDMKKKDAWLIGVMATQEKTPKRRRH